MRLVSTATDRLAAYLAAEAAVLKGQSFSMAGRQLTRADLSEIRRGINDLRREVQAETMVNAGREPGYSVASFR